MLELVHITKNFDTPGQNESVCVLNDITLKVETGQSLVIVGPSGSGKSTLLNIMGVLDRPSSGKVLLDGNELSGLSDIELAKIRNRRIGFVFQLHHLLPQCTVLENVLIPTLAGNGSAKNVQTQERAKNLLERVRLKDFLQYRPGELSGGQRQRVAVVRALINKPDLLLADEPTGSLDRTSSQNIANLLVELNQSEKVALVVVTHSLELASRIGNVMELDNGLLKQQTGTGSGK